MERDRETVIRLSSLIERERAELKVLEQQRAARQKRLAQLERHLDQLLHGSVRKPMSRDLSRMLRDAGNTVDPYKRPTVTSAVRRFFLTHRDRAFATKEVMESCSIPKSHHDAVRKALARLNGRGFLVRVNDGVYRLDSPNRA
jgi:hypothetical protein